MPSATIDCYFLQADCSVMTIFFFYFIASSQIITRPNLPFQVVILDSIQYHPYDMVPKVISPANYVSLGEGTRPDAVDSDPRAEILKKPPKNIPETWLEATTLQKQNQAIH